MSSLRAIEVENLNRFFNTGGYVFDFSTERFNDFTLRSVGIPLCEKFGSSKGKSLRAFIQDGEDHLVKKLLFDLFEYYEAFIETNKLYARDSDLLKKCKLIAESIDQKNIISAQIEKLKNDFNSDYMNSQIQSMQSTIEENPTDAIGKAKELLESCLLTILKKEGVAVDKDWDLPRLSKETFNLLNLSPEDIPEDKKAKDTIRRILGNLANITTGITELRNPYGSGHGKDFGYKGLSPRHARLAVGSASTLVRFIWDTYQEQKSSIGIESK